MKTIQAIAIVVALTATVISFKLLQKHLTGSSGSSWFDAGCGDGREGSNANCAAVLASPYSYWPPKKPEVPNTRGHLPVAFLGLVYYSTMSIWLLGVGAPSRSRWWLHLAPLLLVGIGLLISAALAHVMFRKLDQWCPWCAVTHALNLILAACLVLLWPRRRADSEGVATVPRPTGRQVGITVLAVVFAVAAENQMLGRAILAREAASNKLNFDQCLTTINRLKANPNVLVALFQSTKPSAVRARIDDPMRVFGDPDSAPFDAVVFSDFECPSCKRLAEFMETEIPKLFGGKLRIIFKHNPLNASCNPGVKSTPHKLACEAARLAEAARSLRGNEGFWCVHDYLFKHQDAWKNIAAPIVEAAQVCHINADDLRSQMESGEVATRIREDAEQAAGLGLYTTPGLFAKGRLVDHLIRNEIVFWDMLAELFWKERNEPRPESTKLTKAPSAAAPTEDTRGRRVDP